MKRIEEFTVQEIINIWHDDVVTTFDAGMQAVLEYIKANLDTGKGEGMSVEEIENSLYPDCLDIGVDLFTTPGNREFGDWWKKYLLPKVQKLTVKQGFVVDWKSVPDKAQCVVVRWSEDSADSWRTSSKVIQVIPRPTPKPHKRTNTELIEALAEYMYHDNQENYDVIFRLIAEKLANGEKLDDLCQAAGISLEVNDEQD